MFSDETVERLAGCLEAAVLGADDRRDALARCVHKLSQPDRDLIQLRYQPGGSVQSVADRVGRSLQAVYKSLNRIHGRLLICIRQTQSVENLLS